MNYQKQYADKINWKNSPDTSTPLNATNLNKMDNALNYMDNALYTISKAIGGGSSARGGIISNVGNNAFTTHVHQRTGESLADNELLILRSDVRGTGNSINVYTSASSAVGFDLLDLDGESTSITVTTDSVVVLMITDADTDYTAQVLAVIDTAGGVAYSGLGIGKKTGVSSNVIDTDIDLHRSPMAGDRLLVYFDEKITNPTGLKTYNNGVAVTSNLENATPLYINAGWNILEFKNDGLLYNNVWVRKQNVPVPSTLAGMSDALIVSPSDDQLLVYDNGKWKNQKYIEANVGFSDTELKKIKVGDIVYDTDGLRDYSVSSIANNNITISVLNSNQFVMENIAINTGNHSGSSNGWNLVITDGMNPVSVALKNADGSPFADDIHENELLFVYVDTAGNIARVLEIHSHDLEILKDAIITEKTVSGNPITVTDALPYPAVSVSAEITPIQDLHGYDKPWVGGAGKNLIPLTAENIKQANTNISWSGNIGSINGITVTILTDADNNVTGIMFDGTATTYLYFNVCSNKDWNGSFIISGTPNAAFGHFYQRIYYNDGTDVGVTVNDVTINPSNKTGRLQFVWSNGVTFNKYVYQPMVRLATESDASFAPYSNICPISGRTAVVLTRSDGDEISEDFTIQLGTTVYGADINWDTGVMTVTDVIEDMGNLTYSKLADYIFAASISDKAIGRTNFMSSQYAVVDSAWGSLANGQITGAQSSGYIHVKDERYNDENAFKTAVTGQTICYKLATPTTIQLTPTDLQMLKGYNRLSSDGGGDLTLTYKADRLAAIEAALAALA